jgi:hypothetical protein
MHLKQLCILELIKENPRLRIKHLYKNLHNSVMHGTIQSVDFKTDNQIPQDITYIKQLIQESYLLQTLILEFMN